MWAPIIRSFASSIITFEAANSIPALLLEFQLPLSRNITLYLSPSLATLLPTEARTGMVKIALGIPIPLQKILIFKQNFTSTETTIKNRVFFRERADLGSYSK